MIQYRSLYKVYMVSFWTESFLTFRIFTKKALLKRKICKNCFDEQEKSRTYLKMLRKKQKFQSHFSRFNPVKI